MVPSWVKQSLTININNTFKESLVKFLAHFITLVSACISFSISALADGEINKIIGENDLIAVAGDGSNIPFRYRKLIDAFGLMNMGCTATHIGRGYVLTAGHCFWAGDTPQIDQSCSDTTIQWGYRQDKAAYLTSQCERIIIAQRTDGADFAIIKVSPIPEAFVLPDLTRHAATGDTVTVFSHPDEEPLKWSQLCGVELSHHPDVDVHSLAHRCDTNPGSSGATILNALTLKIVAIHDGGYAGELNSPTEPVKSGMNYGTFLLKSPIYEELVKLGF